MPSCHRRKLNLRRATRNWSQRWGFSHSEPPLRALFLLSMAEVVRDLGKTFALVELPVEKLPVGLTKGPLFLIRLCW